ncbi:hypothetical protein GF325_09450 [Candidatus Bathyarchaeota archaeon]|nr:hypothetical protein [Candidatus Bathyarchaeota archaeon]
MKITRFKQSCFRIEHPTNDGNKMPVYIDPFRLPRGEVPADIVLVSHLHFDHFNKKSIKRLWKTTTNICGAASARKIKKAFPASHGLAPGDSITIHGIDVRAVPAYNRSKFFHKRDKAWVGYLIDIGGKTLYHIGDTDFIPEMRDLQEKDIEVAFMPFRGTFNMDPIEAIEAIKAIIPRTVVPMQGARKNVKKFKHHAMDRLGGVQVLCLEPGDTMHLAPANINRNSGEGILQDPPGYQPR